MIMFCNNCFEILFLILVASLVVMMKAKENCQCLIVIKLGNLYNIFDKNDFVNCVAHKVHCQGVTKYEKV